jgi:hypothetical protein
MQRGGRFRRIPCCTRRDYDRPPASLPTAMTFVLVLVFLVTAALVVFGLMAWQRIVQGRQAAGAAGG